MGGQVTIFIMGRSTIGKRIYSRIERGEVLIEYAKKSLKNEKFKLSILVF